MDILLQQTGGEGQVSENRRSGRIEKEKEQKERKEEDEANRHAESPTAASATKHDSVTNCQRVKDYRVLNPDLSHCVVIY